MSSKSDINDNQPEKFIEKLLKESQNLSLKFPKVLSLMTSKKNYIVGKCLQY